MNPGTHLSDLIDLSQVPENTVHSLLELTAEVKAGPAAFSNALENKTLLMLFTKPSTRTRISFEAGMTQLGGHAINFQQEHSQITRGEPIRDVASVVSGYADAVMARLHSHEELETFAEHATIPVINGLTDLYHPCQTLSDLYTLKECGITLDEGTLTFVGDGNNMAHSLMQAGAAVGMDVAVATPKGYGPDSTIVDAAKERGAETGATITVGHDADAAVDGADAVYTDVIVSMGQDADRETKLEDFAPFQVTEDLMDAASDDAVFMHCLPAHRGEEVTADVIDGPQSLVYQQAENRMHMQKAILLTALEKRDT